MLMLKCQGVRNYEAAYVSLVMLFIPLDQSIILAFDIEVGDGRTDRRKQFSNRV